MTLPDGPDAKRWATLARQLPFEQVGGVRRQAEGWRNGIATATTVLLAAVVVKSRSDVTTLPPVVRAVTGLLVLLAFVVLLAALLVSARAAYGRPGEEIWSTGEKLADWSEAEARRAGRLVEQAVRLAVLGLSTLMVAAAIAWLAPAPVPAAQLVLVRTADEVACGRLSAARGGTLTLATGRNFSAIWTRPLSSVVEIVPATGC